MKFAQVATKAMLVSTERAAVVFGPVFIVLGVRGRGREREGNGERGDMVW